MTQDGQKFTYIVSLYDAMDRLETNEEPLGEFAAAVPYYEQGRPCVNTYKQFIT
jgi:hypothetical protein